MTLSLRLTLWYGLLLALSVVAFASLVYLVLSANLQRQVDDALRLRAAQLARSLSPGADGILDSSDLAPGQLGPLSVDEAVGPDVHVQVLDSRARVIGASGSLLPIDPQPVIDALAGQESLLTLPLSGDRAIRLLTRPLTVGGRTVGVVQVGDTLDGVNTTLAQVRQVLLVGSIAVLAVAGLGGFLLGGRALAPLRQVSATARRITATGDYGQRLPPRPARDETGELVSTFNALIERVQSSLDEQRRFLADTSHELRSPLTVIRANLGFLWRETDPATRAECLREAEAEAERMSRLVTDLLLLDQGKSDGFLENEPIALDKLVDEVAERARTQANGRRLEQAPAEPLVVLGDRDRLMQLLWNLVDNALRYTSPGNTIRLSARPDGQWAEIAVADDGPGIAQEHLPRLFERFYRVDKARSRATGGAGLGLAIVKHIAEAHGGSVSVDSAPRQGSTFRVRLPLASAAAPEGRPIAPPGAERVPRPVGAQFIAPTVHGANR
jgi:signal transduction histidine kinase